MAKIKMIENGNVALCSACNKLSAAALDCECTNGMPTQAARNKFRKTFPRHEHDVAELIADRDANAAKLAALETVQLGRTPHTINETQDFLATFPAGRQLLAALEARAADARTMAWYLSERATSVSSAALAAARRYLANTPAAPAKAGALYCQDCKVPLHLCEGHTGLACAAPSPLAAQLAEAVELLREAAPDSWWTPNRDDWRARRAALLDAIDAGRARAKETK